MAVGWWRSGLAVRYRVLPRPQRRHPHRPLTQHVLQSCSHKHTYTHIKTHTHTHTHTQRHTHTHTHTHTQMNQTEVSQEKKVRFNRSGETIETPDLGQTWTGDTAVARA